MEELKRKKAFISDMDGVIYHGNLLLPGVREFVDWLEKNGKEYLFLTNSSERSPKELKQKLHRLGLDVGEEHFYTSALATAQRLYFSSLMAVRVMTVLPQPKPISKNAPSAGSSTIRWMQ